MSKNPPEFKLTRSVNRTIDLNTEFTDAQKLAWGIEGIARILEDNAVAEDCDQEPLPGHVEANILSGLAATAKALSEKLDSIYMLLPSENVK